MFLAPYKAYISPVKLIYNQLPAPVTMPHTHNMEALIVGKESWGTSWYAQTRDDYEWRLSLSTTAPKHRKTNPTP